MEAVYWLQSLFKSNQIRMSFVSFQHIFHKIPLDVYSIFKKFVKMENTKKQQALTF